MRTKINIRGKSYDIEISEIKENLFKVRVDNEDYFFTKNESQELILLEREDYPAPAKEGNKDNIVLGIVPEQKEIKSPIAGVISNIYVKEGEEIKPGKTVATLIAMKMENEIISETYGKIKGIKVKENQFVNTGDSLIILE